MTLSFDLQDLIEDLKDELGGNFEDVCVMMLASPRETDARELNKAISVCTLCHPPPPHTYMHTLVEQFYYWSYFN